MITVAETWHIKGEFADRMTEVMQEMDDLLGPAAHEDPAWSGHARFYQSEADPARVLMIYPWRSREDHAVLARREEPELREFYAKYCTAPRRIEYYTELPVDVDHDHDPDHQS